MPQIILGPAPKKRIDGSVKKEVFSFLEKLQNDPSASGLHIEPINGSADPRIRTGRVTKFWRAVLVQIDGSVNAHFVYLGTFPHDDAIAFARTARVRVNPRNGIAELIQDDQATRPADISPTTADRTPATARPPASHTVAEPFLRRRGVALRDLLEIGIDPDLAEAAIMVSAGDDSTAEEELLGLADTAPAYWQGLALIDLGTGTPVKEVVEKFALTAHVSRPTPSDDELIDALRRPAARLDFAFIESDAELRAAIEDDDFGRWRVFLHPEQRRYATRRYEGSFRLSGAAGTGKTVVLVHRARELARADPDARIVLTTFNRTLAAQLTKQLELLDPEVPIATRLGEPGVFVGGLDQIALRVLNRPTARLGDSGDVPGSVSRVLGARPAEISRTTPDARWERALAGAVLPDHLRHAAFLQAEYRTVVLPNRITTRDQYVRVRRPGRGTSLSRPVRNAVWDAIEAYRASAAADGSVNFDEKAMIAAVDLDAAAELADDAGRVSRPADHVLVDEAQDLTPAHLHLVRALAAPGRNDLFLADDSQQRIYGNKFVMSHYGIDVRGRSRRLTLNYRTTAQNLRFAVGVLSGERYADLEDEVTQVDGYRSVRLGPPPHTQGTKNLNDAYRQVADLITGWLDDGEHRIQPATIGLLVRQRHMGEKLVAALAGHGVEAEFVEDDMDDGDKPVVMTMHRSKGMEFRKVILFDLSAASEPGWIDNLPDAERADARLRERSLVYVAASRARDELWVIWHGKPSPLLPMRDTIPEEGPESE